MININNYSNNELHVQKFNHQLDQLACRVNQKDLRSDVAEWLEDIIEVENSSCMVLTVVQQGNQQQILPQEYKNMRSARYGSARLLAEVISEFGARCISTEIRNDRLYVTLNNKVKITMTLD